jgi:flagellar biosynthesis regulator FlbT
LEHLKKPKKKTISMVNSKTLLLEQKVVEADKIITHGN